MCLPFKVCWEKTCAQAQICFLYMTLTPQQRRDAELRKKRREQEQAALRRANAAQDDFSSDSSASCVGDRNFECYRQTQPVAGSHGTTSELTPRRVRELPPRKGRRSFHTIHEPTHPSGKVRNKDLEVSNKDLAVSNKDLAVSNKDLAVRRFSELLRAEGQMFHYEDTFIPVRQRQSSASCYGFERQLSQPDMSLEMTPMAKIEVVPNPKSAERSPNVTQSVGNTHRQTNMSHTRASSHQGMNRWKERCRGEDQHLGPTSNQKQPPWMRFQFSEDLADLKDDIEDALYQVYEEPHVVQTEIEELVRQWEDFDSGFKKKWKNCKDEGDEKKKKSKEEKKKKKDKSKDNMMEDQAEEQNENKSKKTKSKTDNRKEKLEKKEKEKEEKARKEEEKRQREELKNAEEKQKKEQEKKKKEEEKQKKEQEKKEKEKLEKEKKKKNVKTSKQEVRNTDKYVDN